MKIYTKTGDDGTTGLIGGERVKKSDLRIETSGTVDELNSHLGLLNALMDDPQDKAFVEGIQSNLFVIGSHLASVDGHPEYTERYSLRIDVVKELEIEIDNIVAVITKQTTFLLPGGCVPAAQAHVCRTVCRRAERRMIQLQETQKIQADMLLYMNRLSDYLYVLARKLNFHHNVIEKKWEFTCR